MLTLAWVYRTGRDLLAPRAGLLAALLLSASVFFLAYMIHARAFTLIALCSTLCIWSYWRVCPASATARHEARRPACCWAALACSIRTTSLRLFLPALGLFHLLFVPKNRRWWRPVLLLVLAALLATAAAARFSEGTGKKQPPTKTCTTGPSRRGTVVSRFVHFMTNGLCRSCPCLGSNSAALPAFLAGL